MIDTAVILATGNPNHTSRLIHDRPRAMLPALGKPMVVRVMEQLYRVGIRHFVVIAGLNEGAVASYLNKQWVPDAKIEFVLQSPSHSLPQMLVETARKQQRAFLISGYNSFTHERFIRTLLKHHEDHPQDLILTGAHSTLSKSSRHTYARMDGERVLELSEQRPTSKHYVLTDLAICGQHFVDFLTAGIPYDKTSVYFIDAAHKYMSLPDAQAIVAETAWVLQVDTDADLLTLNRHLLDDLNDAHILSELPQNVRIINPVRIDPQVSVGQNTVIGPHVYLERGSSVGYGATLNNVVVVERATVPSNANLKDMVYGRTGPITD